ncbi:MAG: cytochrome c, partial [Pirellulaceae bacterium]|nr:cytochrome c [Pirellulaceae bacterium]
VLLLISCAFIQTRVGSTAEFERSKEYRQYCGACHGNTGDGQGEAGRYLYPKPRDLLNGKMRLATSSNMIASADDIKLVLLNGIPNTSMQSWKQLSAGLIDRLVAEVQQMQILGARQRVSAVLKEDGLLVDGDGNLSSEGQQAVIDYTTQQTVPTQRWVAPPILRSSASVLEDGRELYLKQNCHKCHGDQGEGSFGVDLVDDKGFPTFARDLIRDPYKAGSEFDTIARVIRLGMPGTVMPSSGALSDDELGKITVYVQSLAKSPPRQMGNIQRYHRAIGFRP